MNAFSSIIVSSLRDEYVSKPVRTRRGWISLSNVRPELGPPWLIAFNNPTDLDEESYVSQFYRDADPATSRSVHRSCNGVRLFGTRFQIPGVNFLSSDDKGADFLNKPVDFDVAGGLVLPKMSPTNGFVMGTSHAPQNGGRPSVLWDIVEPGGSILTGFFDETSKTEKSFERMEDWLAFRAVQAQAWYEADVARMT